jgi:ribokinase
MPDYFLDRFVRIGDLNQFIRALRAKARKGGGSIRGFTQLEVRGGNAINLACALAELHIKTTAIIVASGNEEAFLRHAIKDLENLDVKFIRGRGGFTVALELDGGNLMVSDTGDLPSFSAEMLKTEHWDEVAKSGWVAIVNWAVLAEHGSRLTSEVFSYAKEHGVSTFIDPADISGAEKELPELLDLVFSKRLVDVFSLNELEAKILAKHLGLKGPPREIVSMLADRLNCIVDLHTEKGAYSASKGDITFSPSYKVQPRYLTGAGDVWDAADIFGYILKLDPGRRLALANAAASCYLTSERAEAPKLSQVRAFLKQNDPTVAL